MRSVRLQEVLAGPRFECSVPGRAPLATVPAVGSSGAPSAAPGALQDGQGVRKQVACGQVLQEGFQGEVLEEQGRRAQGQVRTGLQRSVLREDIARPPTLTLRTLRRGRTRRGSRRSATPFARSFATRAPLTRIMHSLVEGEDELRASRVDWECADHGGGGDDGHLRSICASHITICVGGCPSAGCC